MNYTEWKNDIECLIVTYNDFGMKSSRMTGLPYGKNHINRKTEDVAITRMTLERGVRDEYRHKKMVCTAIEKGLKECSELERRIIEERYFKHMSLREIREVEKIHASGVHKAEVRAVRKISGQLPGY